MPISINSAVESDSTGELSRYGCKMNDDFRDSAFGKQQSGSPAARLRILETTDLHMQLLDYDYFSDKTDTNTGLIRLVGAIARARATSDTACLLFDNGDLIQGNPLADYLATYGAQGQTHPMIDALNLLQYDGMTLGNHEFNYGLEYLRNTLSGANFPIVCGNLDVKDGAAISQPFCIIDQLLICDDGIQRAIKIGVTGFAPPQITQWDGTILAGGVETHDIVDSASRLVPQIKAAGADLIIALCHSGIGETTHKPGMENAAVPLAAVPGIDIVLTGHTHELFPGDRHAACDAIDPRRGTLHGKPSVMAGFYGQRLGVIDLTLGWENDAWQVKAHQVTLENGEDETPDTKAMRDKISGRSAWAHEGTLAHIRQPIAATGRQIHSYFATVGPDPSQALLAAAQQHHVQTAMENSDWRHLPVIAATAPFRFGDRAGSEHYIDIPVGPITLRDAAAIYPFTNTLCGVLQNGRGLRDWLERAASYFMRITPGTRDQALVHPHSPGYNFDTLFGVNYEIDVSQPARFDSEGRVANAQATRIKRLMYNGQDVADTDQFIVATNSYRARGGGDVLSVVAADILYTSAESTRDILINDLRARGDVTTDAQLPWTLTEHANTSATFTSSPLAQPLLTDQMKHLGAGTDGFDRYQLNFSALAPREQPTYIAR